MKLPPREMELYQRVDEVLHYIWDPIKVSGVPEARNEYGSYLPHVFTLLEGTIDGKDLLAYLLSVECDSMGFKTTEQTSERASEVVDILINYREWINEKFAKQILHGSE